MNTTSWYGNPSADIGGLVGKTIIEISGGVGNEAILFRASDGSLYKMYHSQDCCEEVSIDDIVGNLDDLLNTPLLIAREDTNVPRKPKTHEGWQDESYTWTFYNFATVKGYVAIKWYGTSNGYYSESVDFVRAK